MIAPISNSTANISPIKVPRNNTTFTGVQKAASETIEGAKEAATPFFKNIGDKITKKFSAAREVVGKFIQDTIAKLKKFKDETAKPFIEGIIAKVKELFAKKAGTVEEGASNVVDAATKVAE